MGEELCPAELNCLSGESWDESCRESGVECPSVSTFSTEGRMLSGASSCVLRSLVEGTICAFCSREEVDWLVDLGVCDSNAKSRRSIASSIVVCDA
jgi:hypothetical protein